MISFKKMWDDVSNSLSTDAYNDMNIVEKFKTGFVVDEDGDMQFITKDDFVDFWCKMLCLNQISHEQVLREEKSNMKYVYEIIKRLPYVSESSGVLKLKQ